MKTFSSKREERKEKKKKKLLALAKLVQLNDNDRRDTATNQVVSEVGETPITKDDDDGFVKVTHKKKPAKLMPPKPPNKKGKTEIALEDEPETKRPKLTKSESTDGSGSDTSQVSSTTEEQQRLKLQLTEEQYKELRRQLRQRKRELENVPILRLREFGQRASLEMPQGQRTPIFLTDIQHLLMSALIGKKSPCSPDRWCFLEKPLRLSHSVVLILEGLSLYHYLSNESKFTKTNEIFRTRLEVVLPPLKEGSIVEEIAQVPLTNVQAHKLIEQHGSLELAVEMTKDPTLLVKTIFPVGEAATVPKESNLPVGDKFPRTKLLLSALQMVDEGYPMPLRGELSNRFKEYVFTKDKYEPVTDSSPMYGVDCEMCRTVVGHNELTRVSIVNEDLETVYETLVMPTNKIVDYLTPYSGITASIMKTVTKTIEDVQREVRELLPADAILVGQSLNFDLNAMKMMHPYVIDTSMCFNLSGVRRRKAKLQTLAMTFLKEAIQENADGHDSVEDSLASLKLVKMKLANSLEYGDEILSQKKRLHDIMRLASGDNIKNNLLAHASRDRRTAIITNGTLQRQVKEILTKTEDNDTRDALKSVSFYELETNKSAINKAREIALENSLTITNLRLGVEEFQLDNAEKTVMKLDKWIGKLWQTVAHNGMFLVLMGGSTECASGVAKIAIKKDAATAAASIATTTPITV
ncbi:PREDICTED: small RNA degrading nuclease 5 [Bactrocera latifrons]|uniref:small RNA degrading nuclease 5 n=1 Tax=Bactrocera latifrons TaxID=174628 RepID=UPI0008DEA53A|nr:PREDICTED: small RNA degrading nuclease 5 [Bactrocera latifrons]